MKQLKDLSNNAQNRQSSEISSRIFVTYKNSVRPQHFHMHNTASGINLA